MSVWMSATLPHTQPAENGAAFRVIKAALRDAKLEPADIGTSTRRHSTPLGEPSKDGVKG